MTMVADSTRARIFNLSSDHLELQEIEDIVHPEGRLHNRDISSDLPGKDKGINGSGGHAYSNKISPTEHERNEFAKRVATYLDDARKANKISKLLLIVAPRFLGELRSHLSSETSKIIIFELNKNLARQNIDAIKKYIPRPYACG